MRIHALYSIVLIINSIAWKRVIKRFTSKIQPITSGIDYGIQREIVEAGIINEYPFRAIIDEIILNRVIITHYLQIDSYGASKYCVIICSVIIAPIFKIDPNSVIIKYTI